MFVDAYTECQSFLFSEGPASDIVVYMGIKWVKARRVERKRKGEVIGWKIVKSGGRAVAEVGG